MSDTKEAGELSAEAKAFLAGHEQTGEPSTDALERGRLRLEGAPLEVAAVPMKAPPLQLRTRRTLFPPEVLAAAAVVILLLGAQALYLVLRAPIAPAAEPVAEVKKQVEAVPVNRGADLEAVAEAWRNGDFVGARRLAAQDCHSPGCAALDVQLARMLGLAQSVDALSPEEANELATFDVTLTGGSDSALRRRLVTRKWAPATAASVQLAERLFEEGREEKKKKNFEAAVLRLERCIKVAPGYHPCYRMLGSVYASIATRDQSALAMEKARRAYERFLDVAPPDDEYFPKVRAILEAAKADDAPAPAINREVPAVIPLTLYVDGTVKLPLARQVSRLAVGDVNVIDAKVLGPNTVQLEGMRRGKTTVMVWFIDGSRTTLEVEVKVSERRVERVDELFADANKAMAAKDFVLASAFSKQLLELEPSHAGAQHLLAQLRTQAREAYLRGYQLRESNPADAITWFELVVLLTPPEDETHQKAQSRLRDLKR